jgi:two-component system cell cycle sensor histidine kinase/response regulator CckA
VRELSLIHKNGSPIVVEASGRMLPDGRFQSIVRDISDRRAAEDALRRNEELLRKVFDSGVTGTAIGTADFRLLHVNRTFATMLGYEPDEVEGLSLRDLTHPDDLRESLESVTALMKGTVEEVKFEKRYLHREGHSVWASVSLVVVRDESGADHIVAHVLDISHSKALEETLRQAQMMEAVGQLAGGVAHDFNNLLSVIQNFTRFVYEDLNPADPNRRDLEEVLKAGDRGAGLVRQLLTLARREHLVAEVFDVNELMDDMSVLLRRSVTESISLKVFPSADGPHVEMDRSQLEQILLNLAVNARDAMPRGGNLCLRTDVVELSAEEAALAQVEPGEYVRLRANDSGTGMSPDVRRRIFEPFFTTKERGAGTGLGLSTVYGIVVGVGGGIVVDSATDQGTTFDIYLPSAGEPTKDALLPKAAVGLQGKDICVLVVDDEDGVRTIVQRILEGNGYHVLPASNLGEALEISGRSELQIRAVVADVVMPNGSGLELVEQLRIQRPGLPALFISGYSGDVLTAHGLGGDDRYVGKPFTPEEILIGLSAAMGFEFAA